MNRGQFPVQPPMTPPISLYTNCLSNVSLKLLDSLIKRAGFQKEHFHFTSSLSFPSGTKVVLAFGEEPLRLLTGEVGINRFRGHVLGSSIPTICTFAPDYLLPRKGEESSTKYTGVFIHDLRKAVRVAKEGFNREPLDYLIDPPAHIARSWAEDYLRNSGPSDYLSTDIETAYKSKQKDESELDLTEIGSILRIGFCWQERKALTMPWTPEYIEVAKYLLERAPRITTWNGKAFDGPVLETNGINLVGEHFDAMDFWHVLNPVLPRGLEFASSFHAQHLFPWKHTNKSEFALYNAKDADAGLCCMKGIEQEMRSIEVPDFTLEIAA